MYKEIINNEVLILIKSPLGTTTVPFSSLHADPITVVAVSVYTDAVIL